MQAGKNTKAPEVNGRASLPEPFGLVWCSPAVADLSLPAALAAVAARTSAAGRHWQNLPMVVPTAGLGWLLALLSVVAGRIVPSFTCNWLAKRIVALRGATTRAGPLLMILHIGYCWLVVGAALLGLTTLDADVLLSAAILSPTAGAISISQ